MIKSVAKYQAKKDKSENWYNIIYLKLDAPELLQEIEKYLKEKEERKN